MTFTAALKQSRKAEVCWAERVEENLIRKKNRVPQI